MQDTLNSNSQDKPTHGQCPNMTLLHLKVAAAYQVEIIFAAEIASEQADQVGLLCVQSGLSPFSLPLCNTLQSPGAALLHSKQSPICDITRQDPSPCAPCDPRGLDPRKAAPSS